MRNKTIISNYDGHEVKFSYTIEKAENLRVVHIERLDRDEDPYEEHAIIIVKIGCWYYMSCPTLGTAAFGISYIKCDELVAGAVEELGFGKIETEAFTYVILEIAEQGF